MSDVPFHVIEGDYHMGAFASALTKSSLISLIDFEELTQKLDTTISFPLSRATIEDDRIVLEYGLEDRHLAGFSITPLELSFVDSYSGQNLKGKGISWRMVSRHPHSKYGLTVESKINEVVKETLDSLARRTTSRALRSTEAFIHPERYAMHAGPC